MAALPLAIILMLIAWVISARFYFPLKKEERKPQIEGGMARLKQELENLGPISVQEIKAMVIFVGVLTLWATDRNNFV